MARAKILIAEDERIVAEDMKRTLENLGYEVLAVVSTGEEAIKKAEMLKPDLVLADIVLAGKIDGIETGQEIRKRFDIPVVYSSAYLDESLLQRAMITAPFGYIIKPFGERELFSNIEIALHKHNLEKRIAHLNSVLRTIRNVNQIINRIKDRQKLIRGICKNLVEAGGYSSAWIILEDEEGALKAMASFGLNNKSSDLMKLLKHGKIPFCIKNMLGQTDLQAIQDVTSQCGSCPIAGIHKGKGILTSPLCHLERSYGILGISLNLDFINDEEELSLFREVADDVGFALYSLDLEENRKRIEEQLRESEELYRNIVELAQDGIVTVNRQGVITSCNKAFLKITGIRKEDLVGQKFSRVKVIDRKNIPRMMKIFLSIISGKIPGPIEVKWRRPDTEIHYGETLVSLIKQGGRITGFHAITRDITERKKAEQALRESEEKYRLISENTSDYIVILDFQGKYLYASPSHRQLGYEPEELVGQNGFRSLHPDDKKRLVPLMAKYARLKIGKLIGARRKVVSERIQFQTSDKQGRWRHFEATADLIKNPMGKGRAILLISREIPGRRRSGTISERKRKKPEPGKQNGGCYNKR